jgi:hypothetical protein
MRQIDKNNMHLTDNDRSMSKPIYEPVKPRVIKRADRPPMDDDLRRLCLSLFHLLKRRHPEDFRRIIGEMEKQRAA